MARIGKGTKLASSRLKKNSSFYGFIIFKCYFEKSVAIAHRTLQLDFLIYETYP